METTPDEICADVGECSTAYDELCTDMCTQTENITYMVSVSTQTLKTYTREATTSTLTLLRKIQRQVSTQTKFKTTTKSIQLQYPTPKKKKNPPRWRSTIRAKFEDSFPAAGYSTLDDESGESEVSDDVTDLDDSHGESLSFVDFDDS